MKKILSLFLSIVMLLSITTGIDLSAYADTFSGTCGENVTWELDTDTGVLTISGNGNMADYNYDSIAPWADHMFDIKTVDIKYGVTSIGDYAFYDCSSLTSITIPDGVTSIGEEAFFDCSSLTSITIPDSVTMIDGGAFYYCTSLTSITIPDSITSIGNYAFCDCSSLTSITIPDGVMSIGTAAFSRCESLTSINVDSKNNDYLSEDGVLFNKNKTELLGYPAGKSNLSYTIPDSVTSIWDHAFADCSSLTSITISDGVTSIGWYAFYNCTRLTSITISDGVTSIGVQAFYGCSSLTDVYYNGTEEQWKNISISDGNSYLTDANIHYNSTEVNHKYELKETVAATCSKEGYNKYVCTCGLEKTEIISKLKHNYVDGVCQNCGDTKVIISIKDNTKTVDITNGGEYQYLMFVPETSGSYVLYSTGSDDTYGYLYDADMNEIASNDDGAEGTNFSLTYEFEANKTYYFGVGFLGPSDTGSITVILEQACSHNYVSTVHAPTCTESGYTEHICEKCGDNYTSDYVDPLGHNYVNNICTVCGKSEYEYSVLDDGTIEINKYNGNATELEIPSEIDGYQVTSIGEVAFQDCKSSSITIPDSVTSIGDCAFQLCNSLTSITIPGSVISIGNEAFANCGSLTSIAIPDGVTYIGNEAFYDCGSLTSITIPDSVTSIGNYAFDHCYNLVSIVVNENNENYSSLDGVLFNKDKTLLIKYPEGKENTSYTIPGSVTCIGDDAFYGCDSLASITIPNSVTSIGSYAFSGTAYYNNENNWVNDVLYIDNCLIGAKETISGSYNINANTKTIADYAFSWCSNLTSITIPESVTSIGESAFSNCSSLTSIVVNENNEKYSSLDGVLFNKEKTVLIQFPDGNENTSYTTPDGVISICDNAFAGCSSLTSITIPDSVTSIGYGAFYGCSSLTNITIPDSVTSIGHSTFAGCSSLTSITIPDSVTSIGEFAFSDTAYYNNENNWVNDVLYIDNCLIEAKDAISGSYNINANTKTIANYAFAYCDSLTSIAIPDSVTSIGGGAFSNCSSLTSIIIPGGVTSIGDITFYGCISLTSIDIPDSVTSLGEYAFYDCDSLTSIKVPNSVTSIVYCTFSSCDSLTSITIPNSVTSIGYKAFENCTSLSDVHYDGTIEQWNNISIAYGNYCLTNATMHYHVHNYKNSITPSTCTEKGYTTYTCECGDSYVDNYVDAKGHSWNSGKVTKKATCKATGVMTYTCTVCGETKTETIAKKAHTYKKYTTKATTSKSGSVVTKCTACGAVKSKSTIYYPKTIKLSTTTYTYNGKVKTPSVTVKDSKGKTLKKNTDYTVTYAKGRKYVGKYSVKITFKGNYSGSKTLYFTIIPKATSISSVAAKSKGFTVKWKKQTTQTTGYQIQYSTSSKFSSAKTVTVGSNKTTSKTISKLKVKKKYYVRVRTYKTVKVNGKNTKIYSSWSKAKAVTTKK